VRSMVRFGSSVDCFMLQGYQISGRSSSKQMQHLGSSPSQPPAASGVLLATATDPRNARPRRDLRPRLVPSRSVVTFVPRRSLVQHAPGAMCAMHGTHGTQIARMLSWPRSHATDTITNGHESMPPDSQWPHGGLACHLMPTADND
jgi:hypothetical protein